MNETDQLPPVPLVPLSAAMVDELLASSDVLDIKLRREGSTWRCEARSLRASGGAVSISLLHAVNGAVLDPNEEWTKEVGA